MSSIRFIVTSRKTKQGYQASHQRRVSLLNSSIPHKTETEAHDKLKLQFARFNVFSLLMDMRSLIPRKYTVTKRVSLEGIFLSSI